jgi:3-hydroxy-D-aspartate aldolase
LSTIEAASGVYTELQCDSYIFMDANYGRNRDRDGAPTKVFEPSLLVWTTVMSRPTEDRAIVDAGPQGPRCLDCVSMITICR